MDKFLHIRILTTPLQEVMRSCGECFRVRRNRTLDRHKLLSRKQNNNESLHQHSNTLNGLAAKCNFGEQTDGLVHDIFILNMSNKQVQEKVHGT